MFSRRSDHPSEENALTRKRRTLAAQGVPLLELTCSNPSTVGFVHRPELLRALANPASLHYEPHPQGSPETRGYLCADYAKRGLQVAAEDLYLTPSTSDAYGYLFKLLCDPGDNVLIPQPSYPLFSHLATFDSVEQRPYPIRYDGRYYIDVPAMLAQQNERTRAIIVVHPNNPTGSYVSRDEAAALEKSGLPVISDEVFADYALDSEPPHLSSLLHNARALTFSLTGLSKSAALPQLKAAWIAVAGPPALRRVVRRRLGLITDSYLSTSYAVQHALPQLLEAGVAMRGRILSRLRTNLNIIQNFCDDQSPLTSRHVEGGWYATLQLPRVHSEDTWAMALLDRAHLVVHPGYFYDFTEDGMLVLSLLTPPDELREGMTRLRETVSSLC